MNRKILFVACLLIATMAFACKNSENKSDARAVDSSSAVRDTSGHVTVYACPMDTDVTSDQPGKCPKCGMDLEIKNQ